MGEDGKVIYKVVIDDDGVESEAEAAGQKAGSGVERGARPGTGTFKEMMIGAARAIGEAFVQMAAKAVQGVEQIARAGIDFNAKMETYQTAFTTLIGDADAAAAAIEQIRKDAAATPFDVDSLTAANQALLATGMDAGAARKDVLNLANAIAATGGGSAELSRMAANMQQIRNTGKATAMDIRQFANAGINIYGLLADSLGVSVKKAAKMDVTYEQLTAAFAKAAEAGGAYEGALAAQSETFNGRMSTLKDNAMQLAGALTEDLFNQLSGGTLPMVMDWVATLLEAAQTGGIEGAIAAAKGILSNLLHTFLDSLPDMLQTGFELLIGLVNGMAKGSPNASETIRQVLVAILQAIANNLPGMLNAGVNLILALLAGILKMTPSLLHEMPKLIAALGQAIRENAPQFLERGAELIKNIIVGIGREVPNILRALAELLRDIIMAFMNVDWGSVGTNIITGIWEGLKSAFGWLLEGVGNMASAIWSSFKNLLGIHSPSTKFKYIGEMSMEGLEEGFEAGETDLNRTVTHITQSMIDAAGFSPITGGDLERNVSYNLAASTGGTTIVVPISIDGREVARATAWSMGEQLAWEEM